MRRKVTTKRVAAKKKVAKKATKVVKRGTKVMVGRFGSDPVEVLVKTSAKVSDVLEKAGISLSESENIWLNGEKANGSEKVKKGDIVAIVSPKEAGM